VDFGELIETAVKLYSVGGLDRRRSLLLPSLDLQNITGNASLSAGSCFRRRSTPYRQDDSSFIFYSFSPGRERPCSHRSGIASRPTDVHPIRFVKTTRGNQRILQRSANRTLGTDPRQYARCNIAPGSELLPIAQCRRRRGLAQRLRGADTILAGCEQILRQPHAQRMAG